MSSVESKACSELLKKLKWGQKDLKRSLHTLAGDDALRTRKQQLTRRHLAEKSINSVRDLSTKRARLELLSPGTEPRVRHYESASISQYKALSCTIYMYAR